MSEVLQYIIVGLILIGAIGYAAVATMKKSRSFSPRASSCENDCGCGGGSGAKARSR